MNRNTQLAAGQPGTSESSAIAEPGLRDVVYSAFLESLDLSDKHRSSLIDRGLTAEAVVRNGYKSRPDGYLESLAADLARRFGRDAVLSVPGFYATPKDVIRVCEGPGLLIPIRDEGGIIRALTIRPDDQSAGKYRPLSSRKWGGPGPEMRPHVPLGTLAALDAKGLPRTVRITEGFLKCDVAFRLDGFPTIGIPGVNGTAGLAETFQALGATRARLAFDADWRMKTGVAGALEKLAGELEESGFLIDLETWSCDDGKGVDDALLNDAEIKVITGPDALREIRRTAHRLSALVNGHKEPDAKAAVEPTAGKTPVNRTDVGNATRLVARFGNQIRYCTQWQAWLVWDGIRWKRDSRGKIVELAKRTAWGIGAEVATVTDGDEAKSIMRWALGSESAARIDSMIRLANSDDGIRVESSQLDTGHYLLNVANGTLDLKTGRLRSPSQSDLITKLAPVRFDPDATCPRWLAFLETIMAGDQDLIGFLQRAAGSALTGDVADHALFFLYGDGRNGKGTFVETILHILGDYAITIDTSLITLNRNDAHPTGLTDLDGARFVASEEVDQGKKLAEALVKKLVGGNRIKARKMRQDYYEFDPTHKLFLVANHRPEIHGTDEAIWARIKLVPFTVFIPETDRILNFGTILFEEEGAGILAWLVKGCLAWQRDGLSEPAVVQAATEAYRSDSDPVAAFLAELCNTFLDHPTLKTEAREDKDRLYQAFADWHRTNGAGGEPLSGRDFGTTMEKKGYALKKSNGRCFRTGLSLQAKSE